MRGTAEPLSWYRNIWIVEGERARVIEAFLLVKPVGTLTGGGGYVTRDLATQLRFRSRLPPLVGPVNILCWYEHAPVIN